MFCDESLTASALRLTMCLKYSLMWCVVVCVRVCVCVCVCMCVEGGLGAHVQEREGGGGGRGIGKGDINPLANKELLQILKFELFLSVKKSPYIIIPIRQ